MIIYYYAKNSRRGFPEEQKTHQHVKENLNDGFEIKGTVFTIKIPLLNICFFLKLLSTTTWVTNHQLESSRCTEALTSSGLSE